MAVGLVGLALVAVVRFVGTIAVEDLTGAQGGGNLIEGRLNPNTAPWWELTSLPGIGETKGKAIVEHRAQVRAQRGDPDAIVYRNAAELEAVKGIGPKTVARITGYLIFPGDGM